MTTGLEGPPATQCLVLSTKRIHGTPTDARPRLRSDNVEHYARIVPDECPETYIPPRRSVMGRSRSTSSLDPVKSSCGSTNPLDHILSIWLMDTCDSLPHVRTAPVLVMYCLGLSNIVDVDAVDTFTFMFCMRRSI